MSVTGPTNAPATTEAQDTAAASPPPADDAGQPAAQPTDDQSAAAAQQHAAGLTKAQLDLASLDYDTPIPVNNGRYEYEGALDGLSQLQTVGSDQKYEQSRCDCEQTLAALLTHGKGATQSGLQSLQKYAQSQKGPEFAALAKTCKDMLGEVKSDCLSKNDLNELADKMYAAFADKNADGTVDDGGLSSEANDRMQTACGLKPQDGKTLLSYAGDDDLATKRGQAAQQMMDGLKPGETMSVKVTQSGGSSGNHYILVGKKPDGTPFCFDSAKNDPPHFFVGQDAIDHAAGGALVSQNPNKVGFVTFKHGVGAAN
jgi:hypothetical protein